MDGAPEQPEGAEVPREGEMKDLKFRLRIGNKIVGYEKWYPGAGDQAKAQWLYSKDGQYWNPEYIYHSEKDQFTGLRDRQGKEIYEGDIVRYSEHYCGDSTEKECVEVVEWDENEASYPWNLTNTGFMDGPKWCEVIGNIYENPDLLK